jgi:hypothetical protein
MALVSCGECGREVSDKAAACVGCGAPIGAAPVRTAVSGKVEVEATSRRYKNQMIAAVLMLLSGCALLFASGSNLGQALQRSHAFGVECAHDLGFPAVPGGDAIDLAFGATARCLVDDHRRCGVECVHLEETKR